MASLPYNQTFTPPEANHFSSQLLSSELVDMSESYRDHLTQESTTEGRALINDFDVDNLESWDAFDDQTCSLAQEDLLDLDGFGFDGTGDSVNFGPWYEALTTNPDLPSQPHTDILSIDLIPDSHTIEHPRPSENGLADTPSSLAVAIPERNSYHPTPDLTECSTPASSSLSNGPCDPRIGAVDKFGTEDQRWHATLSRSRTADRYFLYGVLTTKIYCRPSCASRRPSRKHVKFFSFPGAIEAAEKTKLRPCKRCKPQSLGPRNTGVLAVSQTLRRVIAETFGNRNGERKEGLKLEILAKSAGLSIFHFHRLFKATTKVTPADFITACHALSLQDYLRTYSTRGVALDPCAVDLSPHWNDRMARKALGGLSAVEYANGARSTSIEYCCVSSPVGDLEVAYSGHETTSCIRLHAVVLSHSSGPTLGDHFLTSKRSEVCTQRLQQCVRELEEECQDRDVELDADVLLVLWRARLWLKLTKNGGL